VVIFFPFKRSQTRISIDPKNQKKLSVERVKGVFTSDWIPRDPMLISPDVVTGGSSGEIGVISSRNTREKISIRPPSPAIVYFHIFFRKSPISKTHRTIQISGNTKRTYLSSCGRLNWISVTCHPRRITRRRIIANPVLVARIWKSEGFAASF
jgi:hypothetical protein